MIDTIVSVNKEVATSLGLEVQLVKSINEFFWREGVKRSIQTGDNMGIFIKNLGTISTSRSKLNLRILIMIRAVRSGRYTGVRLESMMDQLKKLLILRNKLAKHYASDCATKISLEEQGNDSGGLEESSISQTRD